MNAFPSFWILGANLLSNGVACFQWEVFCTEQIQQSNTTFPQDLAWFLKFLSSAILFFFSSVNEFQNFMKFERKRI